MKSIKTVLIEACVVGILLIPFTHLAALLAKPLMKSPMLPDVCKTWNKYRVMEVNLFIAGFLFHIVMEAAGINKWYAKNY